MNAFRVWAILHRFLLLAKRDVHRIFDLVFWPTQDILLLGYTGYWVQRHTKSEGVGLIFLAGLLLWNFMAQVNKEIPWSLAEEFWSDNFTNLVATPLRIAEWMAAVMILGIIKGLAVLCYTITVTQLVFSINILKIGWVLLPIIAILILFSWALGFFTSALIVYYGQKVQVLTWIMGWVFAPFVGIFYPVSILPGWMQTISWAVPPTYLFKFLRELIQHDVAHYDLLLKGLTLGVLYAVSAIIFFRVMYTASKKYGLARLERYE